MPFLVRIPLGRDGIVVKTWEPWPRTSKVYCHRAEGWPAEAEIVERVAVRSCTRRGPAIDLVLDRGRENRSQFVLTVARGREVIFWQSPRTSRQARPGVRVPTARAHGQALEIVVDSAEKYPYRFSHQQATVVRQRLSVGDYAVAVGGSVVAAVERKSLPDLVSSLLSGRLTFALAELASLPRAAVVVEDRYSRLFTLEHAPGAKAAEALAEAQARFPAVPVTFCETRPLAEEWTYRYLGACLHELTQAELTEGVEGSFAAGPAVAPRPTTPGQIREWARRTVMWSVTVADPGGGAGRVHRSDG